VSIASTETSEPEDVTSFWMLSNIADKSALERT